MNAMVSLGPLGPLELVLILAVLLLLFGAAKLPELARGTGRALRIFKAETKGLIDDEPTGESPGELESGRGTQSDPTVREQRDTTN
ncbi:twin-arginine translocase TatA/TatE family subunit [Nocardioides limicola]|uniref:twin-arginine translocase TatA/TatE family subunit n=1 Tax=Nocardioides limicola TaxID=2803368 RepID=UPI0023B2497B|nr:twin-arginine translocase TatA/TatE family subunit [Nocardioides sp. DJM-14]